MANVKLTELGKRPPGSLTRPFRAFYQHIVTGKEYVQTKYPDGKRWVEIVEGGGGVHTKPASPDRSVQYNDNNEFEGDADFTYVPNFDIISVTAGPLVIGETYTITNLLGGDIPGSIIPGFFGAGSGFAPGLTVGVPTTFGTGIGLIVDVTADVFGFVTNVVINTPGSGYTLNDNILILGGFNNGVYRIDSVLGGDDFLNVGAPSNANGISFTATGTTPTDWSNLSELTYQVEIGASVVVRNGGVDTPFVKFPEGLDNGVLSSNDLTADQLWGLPNLSGTISLIEDAASSRTLWVDQVFGDNFTAIPYNRQRAFRTVMAAITAANPGDLVHIRPGDYLESVVLKTNVNIHCMPGVQFGSTGGAGAITDNGVDVTCRVTGYGTVNRRYNNNTVSFTGLNSKIYCEFYEILGAGTKLSIGTSASWAADIHIKCVNMRETAFNYILSKPRSALAGKFKLEVSGEIEILGAKGLVLYQAIGCLGTYTFLINRINFTASGNAFAGGTLLFGTNANGNGPQSPVINMEIDEVIYDYDNASAFAPYAFIHSGASDDGQLAWDLTLKINKPFVLKRRNLLRVQGTNAGITRLSVNVTGNEYQPLIYNNSATHKIFIHDSYLKKPNTGTDLNRIVTTVGDNSFVEYKNVVFHKDSLATDTGELIQLDGAGSTTIFKDCEIYLTGGGATGSVCDGPVGQSDVYFKNTRSNIDNGVNVVDTAVVSGFIANDVNLTDYKI